MSVLIIGAGLGGLCLAQGLQRHGIDATVFERDASLTARPQGYRLHVDSRADDALRQCLPPDLHDRFRATTSRPSTRITVLSEQLRTLKVIEAPPGFSTSVDRLTLREILRTGLRDLRFGSHYTHYERLADDRPRAHFADGTTADGDYLVGADGIGSTVRGQYLPHAEIVDTGTRCVYGRTPLAVVENDLPAPLWDGFCPVTDRRKLGLALGIVQTISENYVMWSLSTQEDIPRGKSPAELHALVSERLRTWHPTLRRLIQEATVEATFAIGIRTSVPVEPWTPSRVTLLGDAIHAMPPSQGSGANLALFDAARLCTQLTAEDPSIGDYEDVLRRVGFAAVRASRDAARGRGFYRFLRWATSGR
ncbi:FAD-dependent oxidoreductase [Cryptosporangium sp. NPDC051539]|uniref:FAD-dependent oxidoreductase n=1 Tax=Cryptosporangium sp. NPDC051539 TaxID=3363962 RepID=UPI0037B404AC